MYILQNVTITLFQIIFVAAAYAKTNAISRACEAAYRNALAILAVATLRVGDGLRLLIYAVLVCRLPSLFSIMFLDTLYSKKWYDMPHIGRGIHSLQRSTISRIGRHSAGYNIRMRFVFYLYHNYPYGFCLSLWRLFGVFTDRDLSRSLCEMS